MPTATLVGLLERAIAVGPAAPLEDGVLAALFGLDGGVRTVGALWQALAERLPSDDPGQGAAIETILGRGTLAQRILEATGPAPDRSCLRTVYATLADCLVEGRSFLP